MKAWLNGPTGVVPLSTAKPTTIGRECCDIVIPCSAVDSKHAIIEYDECGDCFILRDLSTIYGTYVNGCQLCNAAVRLSPGDTIKIGFGQMCVQYEFETDETSSYRCPHYAAELLNSGEMKEKTCLKTSFPHLTNSSTTPSSTASNQSVCQQNYSNGPYQQSRPFSAKPVSNLTPYSGCVPRLNSTGANGQTFRDGRVCFDSTFSLDDILKRDKKICELTDEVHRLRKFEVENRHKDCRLKELTAQVECLQNQLSQAVSNAGNRIEVEALQGRVVDLENQTQLRTREMAEINEQMFKLKTATQKELNDKVFENSRLREELDRFRKEKNVLSGLLTQVQKDISMKDATICRLTSDIDRKKNELSDRDMQIASFQASYCVVESHKQLESALELMRNELIAVAEKLRESESNVKASEERFASLGKVVDKAKAELRQERQQQKDLKKQLDESTSKQDDVSKANDALTHELGSLTSTISRLRRRLQRLLSLRFAANAKNVTVTDDEDDLTDDQIMSKFKEMVEEDKKLVVKVLDASKCCEDLEATIKFVGDCGGKLKEELQVSIGSVTPNSGNTMMALRQELNTVQMLVSHPVLHDFRDILVSMIQVQLGWQTEMVTALESSGFNVRLSDVALAQHVTDLHSKSQESRKVQEESQVKLEEVTRQFQRDLEMARDRGRREVEERSREKLERLFAESEMKIRTEKAVIEQKEKEIYEEKVSHERLKLTQIEERLCCLQKENDEKSEELLFYREQEKQHTEEVECYRKLEAELRAEILERNLMKNETCSSIEYAVRKRYEQEMFTLREQNAHINSLIGSVQERLSKANVKIHRQQLEIASLKCLPSGMVSAFNKTSAGGESVLHPSFEISRVNEKLRAEIRKHQAEIKKLSLEMDKSRSLIMEKDGVIVRLEAEVQNAKEDVQKAKEDLEKAKEDAANIQSQSYSPDGHWAAGVECRAEHHVKLIAKQKAGLAELRKRLFIVQRQLSQSGKAVEDSNASTGLTDDATGHRNDRESKSPVESIPKEVSDETTAVMIPDPSMLPVDDQNEKGNIQNSQDKDLKSNLQVGEQAFSSLKDVDAELPVGRTTEKLSPPPPLTDVTMSGERQDFTAPQRPKETDGEEMTNELYELRNKAAEYESTIEKYEQELLKLRTADVLLESKSWQIDGLNSDVRSLVDEVACLHESLTKVREELRKEKRLNAAAKGKKFQVCGEKDKVRTVGTIVKHTCFHNDCMYKTKDRTKSAEQAKRKSYEIMLLKEEMKKCEKNMERARNVELMMDDTDPIDECIHCAFSETRIC